MQVLTFDPLIDNFNILSFLLICTLYVDCLDYFLIDQNKLHWEHKLQGFALYGV